MSISLSQAEAAITAAKKKSDELGTLMNIAVVDAGANLVAFVRRDGGWLGSRDISIKKVKTARFFDMNTGSISEISQPGGIPIKDGSGAVIGAIGVSSSSVENDHAVAEAGVAEVK